MIYNGLVTLRLCGFSFVEIGVVSPPVASSCTSCPWAWCTMLSSCRVPERLAAKCRYVHLWLRYFPLTRFTCEFSPVQYTVARGQFIAGSSPLVTYRAPWRLELLLERCVQKGCHRARLPLRYFEPIYYFSSVRKDFFKKRQKKILLNLEDN